MINYSTLSDEDLKDNLSAVLDEQFRRSQLRDIPENIQRMATDFETLGGDKSDLVAKINEPSEEETL